MREMFFVQIMDSVNKLGGFTNKFGVHMQIRNPQHFAILVCLRFRDPITGSTIFTLQVLVCGFLKHLVSEFHFKTFTRLKACRQIPRSSTHQMKYNLF